MSRKSNRTLEAMEDRLADQICNLIMSHDELSVYRNTIARTSSETLGVNLEEIEDTPPHDLYYAETTRILTRVTTLALHKMHGIAT